MNNTRNKTIALVPRLLIILVVGFVILVMAIWFFKEDINLAIISESKANVEVNVSSIPAGRPLPAQQYAQSLMNNPDNFNTDEFENLLPAAALMRSEDMFLVGF